MTDSLIIEEIWDVITDRSEHPIAGSYTNQILSHRKGIDKSLEKVGEEATEFIIAVKNGEKKEIILEAADLQFHLLLALKAAGVELSDLFTELSSRRR
jgi:phosphoribosyl-ATP pyrophosphohydrolase